MKKTLRKYSESTATFIKCEKKKKVLQQLEVEKNKFSSFLFCALSRGFWEWSESLLTWCQTPILDDFLCCWFNDVGVTNGPLLIINLSISINCVLWPKLLPSTSDALFVIAWLIFMILNFLLLLLLSLLANETFSHSLLIWSLCMWIFIRRRKNCNSPINGNVSLILFCTLCVTLKNWMCA